MAPADIAAAEVALTSLGYANADGVTGVDDVGGVVHAHTWARKAAAAPTMVDLHHWLSGATAPAADAWMALSEHRTSIDVAGHRVAVLDRCGQAMHLAMHAAQHGAAYDRQLDELALALERWPDEVWDGAAQLAAAIGATRSFAAGLRLLDQGAAEATRLGLPMTSEEDWTIRNRASRPRGTFHMRAFEDATSTRERAELLRRALFPSREWMVLQHPAVKDSALRLAGAYVLHALRAPAWAARAWYFRRRARRAAG